ncbi:cupin domain-containing protein [archaeon]|nr:cupin domain-containing protein [archaeon]
MNSWKDIKKLINYSNDSILSKELVREEHLNVTLFCMAKGTKMSEHTSTKEGTIQVIEGKGTFRLEGEDIPMNAGVFIRMDKDASHSLKAEENTTFILSLWK